MPEAAVRDRLEPGALLLGDRDPDQRTGFVGAVMDVLERRGRQRPSERGEHRPMLAHAAL
jgi:hypothetical protein